MKEYLPKTKYEILRHVGDISQIAGIKNYKLNDGRGNGVECLDIRNGNGFEYTVLPGHGMDIGWCGYKGMPISYIAKPGMTAPEYLTGIKDQWLQCFPGGMLSTCGLSNVGNYCDDKTDGIGMQSFGLHGRIGQQCAKNICVEEYWEGNQYVMSAAGTDIEAQLRGEKFSLRRTITSKLGETCLHIKDVVTNEDFIDRPYMLMYHMNYGFPLVNKGSRIYVRNRGMFTDASEETREEMSAIYIDAPVNGRDEELYFYNTETKNGYGFACIENTDLEILGYVKYTGKNLPYLTEWKMLGEADYVIGLEAGNVIPRGRSYYRERNKLPLLRAQKSIVNELEIGIICGKENIEEIKKEEKLK